jgi:hypothetical protein
MIAARSVSFRPTHARVFPALLLLLAGLPPLVHAQFQQPTAEELTMTADPKAPGSSAVYLYYEETEDAFNHTKVVYQRIKVLAEAGKELATVTIPYEHGVDKVTDIEGRTIHSDGTISSLTDTPADLTDIKRKGFQINSAVFTLPAVEVGSILEFRIRIHRDEVWVFLPTWQVQRKYFVHKAHYSFRPNGLDHLLYSSHLNGTAKVVRSKNDFITLDIKDVPPEPSDEWMPPVNTIRWRVEFFETELSTSQAFWEDFRKRWGDWADSVATPSGSIRKTVAEIVGPSDSDEQKAVKLYIAVQKLDNTDFSRTKSQAERKKQKLKDIVRVEDVWKQQSGTSDDITLLYAAMARAAGLKAWPAYVVNRDRAIFDKLYLSASQFDNNLVIVDLGGKSIYLDPGQKMCPFGLLHWKHTVASGFRLTDKGAIFETTPAMDYKSSTVSRIANLSIDETGNLKGKLQIVMTGPEALHWRQLALQNDEDEVKKQFTESMRAYLPEGVQADFDHFLALQNYEANLVGVLNVSGNIGTATGKRFFLPGLFFESRAAHPFVAQDKRTIPIDIHYPLLEKDEVTYLLPPGFKVESVPPNSSTPWSNHIVLDIHSTEKNDSVTVRRILARNFSLLNPNEYPDLRAFYLKIAAADQQQLVLTRTPAAKGN